MKDTMMPWSHAESSFSDLHNGMRNVTIHKEPGLLHTIGEKGFELMRNFFQKFV